ncbi:hypothetical protein [Parapedobacter tibetensis]|uniref:hypothetical protein n=1 Tax=Parapedobacter tibetensis TaxID=2972951 RepID=UPI00214D8D1D|nr:hypothetical protein [Parapedobacter tibetensis]
MQVKYMLSMLLPLALTSVCLAQTPTNKFPDSGSVGIGTTSPYLNSVYSVLDITGKTVSNGGYIRFATSDGSGTARIFNTHQRLLFDLQSANMYFQWRNSDSKELYRVNSDGSAKWSGNESSYTEVASNASGPFMRQYSNNGTTVSWLIRGYASNGIQAQFHLGGIEVNGRVRAKEVKVETANWPDYVFHEDYALPTLPELEAYIKRHGRLPGIPSAQEAETEGIDLGEMNRKLLEKVEQLTLYLLAQEKQLKANDEREREQNQRMEQLEKLVHGLLPESSQ